MGNLVLFAMKLLGAWNTMKPFEISLHLAENKKAWQAGNSFEGRYIEDQEKLKGFVYGKKSFDSITKATVGENRVRRDGYIDGQSNLCGVIAVYNALQAIGDPLELYAIIEKFETSGIVLNGCMGTSPAYIVKFLKERGHAARFYGLKDHGWECGAYVFGCFNSKKGVKSGMHIMCATKEKDGYAVHNGGMHGRRFETLTQAVEAYNAGESRAVFVIGVGDPHQSPSATAVYASLRSAQNKRPPDALRPPEGEKSHKRLI